MGAMQNVKATGADNTTSSLAGVGTSGLKKGADKPASSLMGVGASGLKQGMAIGGKIKQGTSIGARG